jgi:hypothetical protein
MWRRASVPSDGRTRQDVGQGFSPADGARSKGCGARLQPCRRCAIDGMWGRASALLTASGIVHRALCIVHSWSEAPLSLPRQRAPPLFPLIEKPLAGTLEPQRQRTRLRIRHEADLRPGRLQLADLLFRGTHLRLVIGARRVPGGAAGWRRRRTRCPGPRPDPRRRRPPALPRSAA